MDLLPAQATSVPCERVFSASKGQPQPGGTASNQKSWRRHKYSSSLQKIKGKLLSKEEELGDLEEREGVISVEDVRGFLNNMHEEGE